MNNPTNSPKINQNMSKSEVEKAKTERLRRMSQQKHIMRIHLARLRLQNEKEEVNAKHFIKSSNFNDLENSDLQYNMFISSLKNSKENSPIHDSSRVRMTRSNVNISSGTLEINKKYPSPKRTSRARKCKQNIKTGDTLPNTNINSLDNSNIKKIRSAPVKKCEPFADQDGNKKKLKTPKRSFIPRLQRKSVTFENDSLKQAKNNSNKLPNSSDEIKKERHEPNVKRNLSFSMSPKRNSAPPTLNKLLKKIKDDKPQSRIKNELKPTIKNNSLVSIQISINRPSPSKVSRKIGTKENINNINNESILNDKSKDVSLCLNNTEKLLSPPGSVCKNVEIEEIKELDDDIEACKDMNEEDNIHNSSNFDVIDYFRGKSPAYKLLRNQRIKNTVYPVSKVWSRASENKWKMPSTDKLAYAMGKKRSFKSLDWRKISSTDSSIIETDGSNHQHGTIDHEAEPLKQNTSSSDGGLGNSDSDAPLLEHETSDSADILSIDEMVNCVDVFRGHSTGVPLDVKPETTKLREKSCESIKESCVSDQIMNADDETVPTTSSCKPEDSLICRNTKNSSPKPVHNCKIPVWTKLVQTFNENTSRNPENKQLLRSMNFNKPTLKLDP